MNFTKRFAMTEKLLDIHQLKTADWYQQWYRQSDIICRKSVLDHHSYGWSMANQTDCYPPISLGALVTILTLAFTKHKSIH